MFTVCGTLSSVLAAHYSQTMYTFPDSHNVETVRHSHCQLLGDVSRPQQQRQIPHTLPDGLQWREPGESYARTSQVFTVLPVFLRSVLSVTWATEVSLTTFTSLTIVWVEAINYEHHVWRNQEWTLCFTSWTVADFSLTI